MRFHTPIRAKRRPETSWVLGWGRDCFDAASSSETGPPEAARSLRPEGPPVFDLQGGEYGSGVGDGVAHAVGWGRCGWFRLGMC